MSDAPFRHLHLKYSYVFLCNALFPLRAKTPHRRCRTPPSGISTLSTHTFFSATLCSPSEPKHLTGDAGRPLPASPPNNSNLVRIRVQGFFVVHPRGRVSLSFAYSIQAYTFFASKIGTHFPRKNGTVFAAYYKRPNRTPLPQTCV